MLRFTAFFWACSVSWICAAFLHFVDTDMNSFQSLFAPAVIVSISLLALVVLIPAAFCYKAYRRGSWRAFLLSVCAFAICLGTFLMLLGFGGNSAGPWFVGFVSSTAAFGVVLAVATLPMVFTRGTRNEASGART